MLRRTAIQAAGASRRASAVRPLAGSISSSSHSRGAKTFAVEDHDLSYEFPRERPGLNYAINWSLCKTGVVPLGQSFRNLKPDDLKKLGGSFKTDAPKVVPFDKEIDRDLTAQLGSEAVTRYIQDSALGALAANEVTCRLVTDSPAVALAFRTLMSRSKLVPADVYLEQISVLHVSSLGSRGSIIAYNAKENQILMAGSFNANALVEMLASCTSDLFHNQGVLPIFGAGDAGGTAYCSHGVGVGKIKDGFALSAAGFCRLYMGSVCTPMPER